MATDRRALLAGLLASPLASSVPVSAQGVLTEADADRALNDLLILDLNIVVDAIKTLDAYRQPPVVPGLIFLLRFSPAPNASLLGLLLGITGDTEQRGWFEWMIWQERHPEIVPTAGYVALKSGVFRRIDPNFDVFLKPEYLRRDRTRIRFEEVTWGGVRKDAIPALDNPEMIAAGEAVYLRDEDPVFGVSINGDARAYPLRIMGWHEMFNQVIGGVPVTLAYCTLCGAGILFETDIAGRGRPFVFGSSGFLYRSNKLMFDRQTHTLWSQFTGRPVIGELAGSEIALRQRAVTIASWSEWRRANPATRVLSLETGHTRDYGSGVAYRDYITSPDLMFPAEVDQSRLKQKDRVFGIRSFGAAKAWPLAVFDGGRVINDSVGGLDVVLIGNTQGQTVRAFQRDGRVYEMGDEPGTLISDGAIWQIGEENLSGPGGESAPRVAGHVAYWFAWDSFLGARSELYEG